MTTKIIGLLARSRSGKDTVADYIFKQYSSAYVPIITYKFAAPVKEAVCALYGFTRAQVEGPDKEKVLMPMNISPRDAMVHLSKSIMDYNGPDFFSKRVFDQIEKDALYLDYNMLNKPIISIISDLRFENDAEQIHKRGGIVVKIERDDIIKHSWEDNIDSMAADYVIRNNGTLAEFHKEIDDLFHHKLKFFGNPKV